MNKVRVAVFIDAENLIEWIKNDGVIHLMEELNSVGQIIIRKAYGKWSSTKLQPLQETLNQNGFELVHTYHPVSGKNSTDIKMTVDAMEFMLRDSNIAWVVLATGDSDFSPLFQKLRELGKEVIGVGPKSPLSECVKTSCSRYIYTDSGLEIDHENDSDLDEEKFEYMEEIRRILSEAESPLHLSILKNKLLQFDNAFNEKRFGYRTFSDFAKSIDFVIIEQNENGSIVVKYNPFNVNENFDEILKLRKILKSKKWDLINKSTITKIYKAAVSLEHNTKRAIVDKIVLLNIEGTTSSIINKVIGILFKSKLVEVIQSEHEEKHWIIKNDKDYLKKIDSAMLSRLISGLKEESSNLCVETIKKITYADYKKNELQQLINENKNGLTDSEPDGAVVS